MGTGEFIAGGNPSMDLHPIQGGVAILLVASCYGNRDKLRPDGPLGSYADFKKHVFRSALTCARSKIFNFFHNLKTLNSSSIKIVGYVRFKSVLLNCFDILMQEKIFSRKDISLFGLLGLLI